jgi:glutamate-1-semialdehyde 2,1-aminomutase
MGSSYRPKTFSWIEEIAHRFGAVLIFDEVITGFRVARGGAQDIPDNPDLTCLGKIIGGGLPLAAFGGKRKIMDLLRPGRFIKRHALGQSVAIAAGLKTIELLARQGTYEKLKTKRKILSKVTEVS